MPQLDVLSEAGWVWEGSFIGTVLAMGHEGLSRSSRRSIKSNGALVISRLVISILRKWKQADPLGLTSHPA